MKDLGYPKDAGRLLRHISSQSNTIFTGEHFGQTQKIPIQRGTIQGDTPTCPYLFIIFVEPLLQWLQHGKYGYTLGTSKVTINSAAYADDLAIITKNLTSLQNQLNKLDTYCEWAGMDLGIPKCALSGCPNTSMVNQETFKVQIQATNITYRNQPLPIPHQNEPYESRWGQIFYFWIALSSRKGRCWFLNFSSHPFYSLSNPVLFIC